MLLHVVVGDTDPKIRNLQHFIHPQNEGISEPGRATPLLWKTVNASTLKGQQNDVGGCTDLRPFYHVPFSLSLNP